eukprot:m.100315 g.100315  ORF g.100315 m.100315 type:complete len:123 (+) comp10343_c0_seq1:1517-1885(+)
MRALVHARGVLHAVSAESHHVERCVWLLVPVSCAVVCCRLTCLCACRLVCRYWILGWLTTLVVLNYLVGPFVELTADASIKYWNNQYWFLHIAVAFVLVTFPGKAKPKKDAAAVAGVDKKTS